MSFIERCVRKLISNAADLLHLGKARAFDSPEEAIIDGCLQFFEKGPPGSILNLPPTSANQEQEKGKKVK